MKRKYQPKEKRWRRDKMATAARKKTLEKLKEKDFESEKKQAI